MLTAGALNMSGPPTSGTGYVVGAPTVTVGVVCPPHCFWNWRIADGAPARPAVS